MTLAKVQVYTGMIEGGLSVRVNVMNAALYISFVLCLGCASAVVTTTSGGWIVELPRQDRDKMVQLLRAKDFAQLNKLYVGYQKQYEESRINDQELTMLYQAFYETSPELEDLFTEWINQHPTSYPARLARGIYYSKVGEERRGTNFASLTPRQSMIELVKYLEVAMQDFNDSLALTRKPITAVLHLMNSSMHGAGKESRLVWLNYADRIAPENYGVKRRYMMSLTPRWGGTYEDMWAYLNVCREQHILPEYLRVLEAMIYLDQAKALDEQNQRIRALPLYRQALSLLDGIDNSERLAALKGVVYDGAATESVESVVPEIEEALRLAPDERQILRYRGWIRFKQQRVPEGLADYAKAAELGDSYSQLQYGKQLYYGVPPYLSANRQAGLVWLKKSAGNGEDRARQLLKELEAIP